MRNKEGVKYVCTIPRKYDGIYQKVEATRAQRMATEPRRLTADEKDALLKKFHPDYNPDAFAEIKVGPNKGQKAPLELAEMLHSTSRLIHENVTLKKLIMM